MARRTEDRIAPILKRLALLFALASMIMLPGGYWSLKHSNLVGQVEMLASVKAATVNILATASPELWVYQRERLEEMLSRYPVLLPDERATIRDAAGNSVLTMGGTPDEPVLVRSSPVYDSGRVVGRVEIAHSYRGVLSGALIAALLGSLLGAAFYVILVTLPLRALGRVTDALNRERDALRRGEENYRLLFESNPHPMWVFDEETLAFLAVNDAAVAKYGWSREEFQAMSLADIRPAEDAPGLREMISSGKDEELRIVDHSRHRTKDGTLIDVEISSHVVDFGGRRARVVSAFDVTQRKRAEQLLRESEARFRSLTNLSSDWYWEQDRELRMTLISSSYASRSGTTPDKVLGKRRWEEPNRQPLHGTWDEHRAVVEAHKPFRNFEYVRIGEDGRKYFVSLSGEPIFDAAGNFDGYRGVGTNITERIQAAESLRSAEEDFHGLVEQSIAGIYTIQDGVFAYVNPRFAEIFGYGSLAEMVGLDLLSLIAEKDRGDVAENMRRLLSGAARNTDYIFTAVRKDGSRVEVGANSARATYRGRPAIIGLLQDISEKKRADEQIKRYVTQLENAFMQAVEVATALSELRDPYTAGHERRVAEIAVAIGAELGFDARRMEGLRVAGYLHDVGKITIPAEILAKPSKLTPIEYRLIQGHSQASYDVLKNVEFPWPIAEIALQHHERMDGGGYPRGLKGEAILFEARILAVADTIEAMSSHRPYRPGLGIEKALGEIERGRGTVYDPSVVDACLKLFREKNYEIPA